MRYRNEDPGVMSLGLFALCAFLVVGTVAAILGRDAGVDPDPMPFTSGDSVTDSTSDSTGGFVQTGMLPAQVTESSGLARSRRAPDVWFTHNDGNDGRVFAVHSDGSLIGTWRLPGVQAVDIEDIAAAPCPVDGGAACLYLGDIGDNDRSRRSYTVYVVREPDHATGGSADARLDLVAAQPFDYGGRSHDAEALAVQPDGTILIITKESEAQLFRLPPMRRALPGAPREIQSVQPIGRLEIDGSRQRNWVTAAAVSPSGDVLAVRSDVDIALFGLPGHELLTRCEYERVRRRGEGIDFLDERTLYMTFEAGSGGRAPIGRVRCAA